MESDQVTYSQCMITTKPLNGYKFDPTLNRIIEKVDLVKGSLIRYSDPKKTIGIFSKLESYILHFDDNGGMHENALHAESIEYPNIFVVLNEPTKSVLYASKIETQLLHAISDPTTRFLVFTNKQRMKFLMELICGSECYAKIGSNDFIPVTIKRVEQNLVANKPGLHFEVAPNGTNNTTTMYNSAYGSKTSHFGTNGTIKNGFVFPPEYLVPYPSQESYHPRMAPQNSYQNSSYNQQQPPLLMNGRPRSSSHNSNGNNHVTRIGLPKSNIVVHNIPITRIPNSSSMQFSKDGFADRMPYDQQPMSPTHTLMMSPDHFNYPANHIPPLVSKRTMPVSNTYDGLSGHTNNQIAKEKKVASHGSLLTKSNGEDRSFVKMMGKGFEKIKAKTTPAPGPVETRVFDSNSGSYCSHNRPGSFAPNDRFVFVDVNKQVHRGLVKYTGIFPQSHLENYIGVEFDEPIGKGDGICSGKQMFNSKDNHAGLIHASMCKKELEYERDLKEVVKTSHNIDQIRLSPKIDKGETVMINHLGYNFIGRVITHFYNSSNINSKWVVCQLLNAKVPENWKKLDNKDRPFCPDSAIHMLEAKPDQCTIVPLDCISPYIEVLTNGNSSMKAEPITSLPSYSANNLSYAPNNSNYGSNYLPPSYADSQRSTPQVQSYNGNGHLKNFGSIDSGIEDRPAMPCRDFDALYGKMKGIQGHNNSCYLDATLYTMFLQSNIFDDLILNKKRDADDIPEFEEAQRILKSEIVYPLRKFHFVRADHVLKLRILLGKVLNDQVGMTSDEKDPEEFMTALFEKVFKVKPLLRLQNMSDNKAHDTYLCPLIADDAWTPRQLQLMNLQYLFDRSMYSSSVEFANIPKVLIVQLPRSAEQKVFDRILPTMTLDISSFLHNTVRPCGFCRKAPAKLKCNECFLTKESYMKDVTFCQNCFDKCHTDNEAHRHVPTIINSNSGQSPSNVLLKLSGVLCIETSHYVTFVNCNVNSATPETDKFVFFDSMADREGTTDGYNIPKVEPIPDVAKWLTADGACRLSSIIQDYGTLSDKSPEYHPKIKRLLNDCYICIYQYVDELNYNDANCMYGRTTSRV